MASMEGAGKTWVLATVALLGTFSECRAGDALTPSPDRSPTPFSSLSFGMHRSTAPALPPRAETMARIESPAPTEMPARPAQGLSGAGARDASPGGRGEYGARRQAALDLRPPDSAVDPGADTEAPFPSRPHASGAQGSSATDAPAFHSQDSRAKQIAEHFHREGLPMARLWETHSALLSLGLNQRGKPGLWLVQKTH
jgi:hypothetical protein